MTPNLNKVRRTAVFDVKYWNGYPHQVRLCYDCAVRWRLSHKYVYVRFSSEIIQPFYCPECGAVNVKYRASHGEKKGL